MNECCVDNCVPLMIQQKVGGSDVFNRSWSEYKVGFSDRRGNYWLGNDLLSQLTLTGRYKLRFDLQSRSNNSNWYYAEYSTFIVQRESSNFRLNVSGYSGNAGRVMHSAGTMIACSRRLTETTTRIQETVQPDGAADSGSTAATTAV